MQGDQEKKYLEQLQGLDVHSGDFYDDFRKILNEQGNVNKNPTGFLIHPWK
jgi:hypothetical protein